MINLEDGCGRKWITKSAAESGNARFDSQPCSKLYLTTDWGRSDNQEELTKKKANPEIREAWNTSLPTVLNL